MRTEVMNATQGSREPPLSPPLAPRSACFGPLEVAACAMDVPHGCWGCGMAHLVHDVTAMDRGSYFWRPVSPVQNS